MNPIRPALETLSELDEGRFMDKLAVRIHEAVNAVTTFGRPAKVTVTIDIDTLKKNIDQHQKRAGVMAEEGQDMALVPRSLLLAVADLLNAMNRRNAR